MRVRLYHNFLHVLQGISTHSLDHSKISTLESQDNEYRELSDAQEKVLALLPIPSATLSGRTW
jgi:hypothetical protein